MNRNALLLLIPLLVLFTCFSIKPRYGESINIRLNEPTSFSINNSSYSNLIFFSMIYENFFYASKNGNLHSNLFQKYFYNHEKKTLVLEMKNELYFSNGEAITVQSLSQSLKNFLNSKSLYSSKLSRNLKMIRGEQNRLYIDLHQDDPDIIHLLTAPELIVQSSDDQAFSGPYSPSEWQKGKSLILKVNPFYPGGRAYLDSLRILFENTGRLDLFLSSPSQDMKEFNEMEAGIFQNIYLVFLDEGVGQNTKVALYSLFKHFNESLGKRFGNLNSLTLDSESPVSMRLSVFNKAKMLSILRFSEISLYILASFNFIEKELNYYLSQNNTKLQAVFIDDAQLQTFISTTPVKFILINKVFQSQTPPEEKLLQFIKEFKFLRFNEKYLRLVDELEEIKNINNQELLFEQMAKIQEAFINDGVILPLFQKRYSLYAHKKMQNLELDDFGRPFLYKTFKTNE